MTKVDPAPKKENTKGVVPRVTTARLGGVSAATPRKAKEIAA